MGADKVNVSLLGLLVFFSLGEVGDIRPIVCCVLML